MPKPRKTVEDLESKVISGQKKFVRYDEGAQIYSLGLSSFKKLAHDAGAVYKIKRCVLVNTKLIDAYLEAFKEDDL